MTVRARNDTSNDVVNPLEVCSFNVCCRISPMNDFHLHRIQNTFISRTLPPQKTTVWESGMQYIKLSSSKMLDHQELDLKVLCKGGSRGGHRAMPPPQSAKILKQIGPNLEIIPRLLNTRPSPIENPGTAHGDCVSLVSVSFSSIET